MNSAKLIELLHRCYGADTACGEWKPTVPALNQCAVVALAVQDMCGGTILRAPMSDGDGHYYNAINGEHVDMDPEQIAEDRGRAIEESGMMDNLDPDSPQGRALDIELDEAIEKAKTIYGTEEDYYSIFDDDCDGCCEDCDIAYDCVDCEL